MKQKIEKILSGQIPISILFIILGFCLVVMPIGTLNVLCKVAFGLSMMLSGLYHIVKFIRPNMKGSVSALDLYAGVISFVMGMFLFSNSQIVVKLLPWMLGAFIIADCIWMVQNGMTMNKLNADLWVVLLACALIFFILGVVLVLNPFRQVRTMLSYAGWVFLIKGILDVFLYLDSNKKIATAMAAREPKTQKPVESSALATVEPQRPSAPNSVQEWAKKRREKREKSKAAREEAKRREQAENEARIKAAQEKAAAFDAEMEAKTMAQPTSEPMNADYVQVNQTEGEDIGPMTKDVEYVDSEVVGGETASPVYNAAEEADPDDITVDDTIDQ